MKTNFRFKKNWKKWVIITHWLLSHIEKDSIKSIENIFFDAWFSTICFDIFWHWKSEWKIEDLTLSLCFEQIKEMKKIFLENEISCEVVYWTSFSTLPILRFWNEENEVKNIFLKVPVFNYREKRERELWPSNIEKWKKEWIIEIIPSENWKPAIFSKYIFLKDFDENFSEIFSKNTKNIFVWAWINDEEVLIDDLREKEKLWKIFLKEYEDWHRFSDKNQEKFCLDIKKYLEKNL